MNLDQILTITICSGFTVFDLIALIVCCIKTVAGVKEATEDTTGLKKACRDAIKACKETNEKLDTVLKENAQLKAKLKGLPIDEIK